MSSYGTPPPPPPPGAGAQGSPTGYGAAPQGYNAPPPPSYGMAPQGAVPYASWIQRVGAYIIDQLLLLPGWVLYFIGMPKTTSVTINDSTTTSSSSGNIALIMLGGLIMLGITIWNRYLKMGKTGYSVGKGVVGIKLIGEGDQQPLGAGRAFLRDLCHILDGLPCDLGYLWPLWDAKKQTFADKLMNTIVVAAPK